MGKFESILTKICSICDDVAKISLLVLTAVFCLNIIVRIVYKPIIWAYDVCCLLNVLVIACALPLCSMKSSFVRVELVCERLPGKVRHILEIINCFLALAGFLILNYAAFQYTMKAFASNSVSLTVGIPYAPFAICLTTCFAVMCVTLLFHLIKAIVTEVER